MWKSILSYLRTACLDCGLTRLGMHWPQFIHYMESWLRTSRLYWFKRCVAWTSVKSTAPSSSAADYLHHGCVKASPITPTGSDSSVQNQLSWSGSWRSTREQGTDTTLALFPWIKLGLFMLWDPWWQPLSCLKLRKQSSLLLKLPAQERFATLNKLVSY